MWGKRLAVPRLTSVVMRSLRLLWCHLRNQSSVDPSIQSPASPNYYCPDKYLAAAPKDVKNQHPESSPHHRVRKCHEVV